MAGRLLLLVLIGRRRRGCSWAPCPRLYIIGVHFKRKLCWGYGNDSYVVLLKYDTVCVVNSDKNAATSIKVKVKEFRGTKGVFDKKIFTTNNQFKIAMHGAEIVV